MTIPGAVPRYMPALQKFYLGAGGSMQQLTIPDSGYKVTIDQGKVDHQLLGGPHAVQRLGKNRRVYQFDFSTRDAETLDLVTSIYAGMLGTGPYYLIDPAWRNLLPAHISGAGKITQASSGFFPTAGTVVYNSVIVPPARTLLSGIQAWSAAVSGTRQLWLNASAANITETGAPPYCQAEPYTFGVWLSTASSTATVSLLAYFTDVNGVSLGTQTLVASAVVTTAWQRFGGGALAGTAPAGAATMGLALQMSTASPPTVYVAAPDLQLVTATVAPTDTGNSASILPRWVLGLGVPRVLPYDVMPANPDVVYWRRSQALSFVETE